jgi:hypothetical protein
MNSSLRIVSLRETYGKGYSCDSLAIRLEGLGKITKIRSQVIESSFRILTESSTGEYK